MRSIFKSSFYNELTNGCPWFRAKIEKKIEFVEKVRDNLKEYDNKKYVAAIASLKKDIELGNIFVQLIIPFTGIMVSIFVFDFTIYLKYIDVFSYQNILVWLVSIYTFIAMYRLHIRSQYIELLSILESSQEYTKDGNCIDYDFEIEIDDKVVGKLILKEEK